ncbi:hypothetical protein F5B21DRAFT_62951 [Xylaria acuta]|nr:hypothetical protein F5B21DRAFT_62951 [Xylaria acuta]
MRILRMFLAVCKCLPSCSCELDGSETKTSLCWQCVLLKEIHLSGPRDMTRVETRRFHTNLQRRYTFSLRSAMARYNLSDLPGVALCIDSSAGTHLELVSKLSACPVLIQCWFSNTELVSSSRNFLFLKKLGDIPFGDSPRLFWSDGS